MTSPLHSCQRGPMVGSPKEYPFLEFEMIISECFEMVILPPGEIVNSARNEEICKPCL